MVSLAALALASAAALAGSVEDGSDRVEWVDDGVRLCSDSHWSLLTSTTAIVGPEPWRSTLERVTPSRGAGIGIAWVQARHSFSGATAPLLDQAQNSLDDPDSNDPFTSQIAPAPTIDDGVHIEVGPRLAFEVEAGYTIAFLPEVGLEKSVAELEAVRAPFGLDPLRLGVAATIPIGQQAAR